MSAIIIIIKNSSTPGANMHPACGRSHRGHQHYRKAALVAGSKGRVSVSALALVLPLALPSVLVLVLCLLSWRLLCGHLHRRPCWDWCWCVVLPFVGLVFAPVSVVLAFALVSVVLAFVLVVVILAFVPVSVVLVFAPASVILAFVPVSVVLAFVLVHPPDVRGGVHCPGIRAGVRRPGVRNGVHCPGVRASVHCVLLSVLLLFVRPSIVRRHSLCWRVRALPSVVMLSAAAVCAAVHCAWCLSCCCSHRRPSSVMLQCWRLRWRSWWYLYGCQLLLCRPWLAFVLVWSCWGSRAVYLLRVGTHVPITTSAKNRLSSLFSVHGTHLSCTCLVIAARIRILTSSRV
jgi:hypothetical protein